METLFILILGLVIGGISGFVFGIAAGLALAKTKIDQTYEW